MTAHLFQDPSKYVIVDFEIPLAFNVLDKEKVCDIYDYSHSDCSLFYSMLVEEMSRYLKKEQDLQLILFDSHLINTYIDEHKELSQMTMQQAYDYLYDEHLIIDVILGKTSTSEKFANKINELKESKRLVFSI